MLETLSLRVASFLKFVSKFLVKKIKVSLEIRVSETHLSLY